MTGQLERRRTHGGRVAHLVTDERVAKQGYEPFEAICGTTIWAATTPPVEMRTCKACERKRSEFIRGVTRYNGGNR